MNEHSLELLAALDNLKRAILRVKIAAVLVASAETEKMTSKALTHAFCPSAADATGCNDEPPCVCGTDACLGHGVG